MKLSAYFLPLIFALSTFNISCTKSKSADQNQLQMLRAEQIKISELKSVLVMLQNRQLEYEFFGITSNGVDCIYFVPAGESFNIEFEVMSEEQKPWFDKLKEFAKTTNYKTTTITYNNEPTYQSPSPAPVLRIETNSDVDETADIAETIMTKVFSNSKATAYDIVP
jgi:hypothetical protein